MDASPKALEPLLTVSDVARAFRVSRRTVYRLVEQGALRAIRLAAGGDMRFRVADVQVFLELRAGAA